jgi:hypothetical protein
VANGITQAAADLAKATRDLAKAQEKYDRARKKAKEAVDRILKYVRGQTELADPDKAAQDYKSGPEKELRDAERELQRAAMAWLRAIERYVSKLF